MISVKGGTQTWTNSNKNEFKSDGAQNLAAGDKSRVLGGEDNVGDVLNKVADANYVAPQKHLRTTGSPELGKDAFMSLLLAQMKNQDPTNPLKSHEMAAQLAQFTSLEKLNNINEGISGLRKDSQPSQNFQALSFIGKTVATDTSKINHLEKEARHDVTFELPADANELKIEIKDAEGKVVRTQALRNLKAGKNQASWNGQDDQGSSLPPGEFTASFEATGSNGHKLHVETKTQGTISGVNFTAAGPQLLVGKQSISMSEVRLLTDPAHASEPGEDAASNSVDVAPAAEPVVGPKKVEIKKENKPGGGQAAKLGKGNLNEASMTQGLINKLNGAGAKAGMG